MEGWPVIAAWSRFSSNESHSSYLLKLMVVVGVGERVACHAAAFRTFGNAKRFLQRRFDLVCRAHRVVRRYEFFSPARDNLLGSCTDGFDNAVE